MTAKNNDALIIFSRLPIGHETKTRLSPLLKESQREELHIAMWHDIFREAMKLSGIDIFLYWTGSGNISDYREHIPPSFLLCEQCGENLGVRMCNAMRDIFSLGYSRAILIGSDIPSLKAENIARAFGILDGADTVLGPSGDGGYWLIGMRGFFPEAFGVKSWGNSDVLTATAESLKRSGIVFGFADTLNDIDTPEDVRDFMKSCNDSFSAVYKFFARTLFS